MKVTVIAMFENNTETYERTDMLEYRYVAMPETMQQEMKKEIDDILHKYMQAHNELIKRILPTLE